MRATSDLRVNDEERKCHRNGDHGHRGKSVKHVYHYQNINISFCFPSICRNNNINNNHRKVIIEHMVLVRFRLHQEPARCPNLANFTS